MKKYGVARDIDPEKLQHLMKEALINLGEVVILDEEGRMVYISEEYAQNMGISIEDSLGKNIREVIPDTALLNVLKSGHTTIGSTYYRNGNSFWVNRIPLKEDGKIIGIVAQSILTSSLDVKALNQKFGYVVRQLNYYRKKYEQATVARFNIDSIVSKSRVMEELKDNLKSVAATHSTVLLRGESGTGKEVFANAIHTLSSRCNKPFVKINCAAIPDALLESELFGYTGGAFTGALKEGKIGYLEAADGGTVFLDEINSLSMNMQAKLLRVIQEREIKKVGSSQTIPIDVRFVFATNENLMKMMKDHEFRSDFYYRINVINLMIPPLRDRMEDVEPLVESFIEKFNGEFGKSVQGLEPSALRLLQSYDWPGNVRELENCIERAFNYCQTDYITLSDIEIPGITGRRAHRENQVQPLREVREEAEKLAILHALEVCQNNKQEAARRLGIDRSVLYDKIKKYQLYSEEPY